MPQPDLLTWVPPPVLGSTFNEARDGKRLAEQAQRVFNFMADGQWHTLREISVGAGAPEASCSARLRDIRRGGATVLREHVEAGLWRYKVIQSAA
jgi:hypothetical protein